MIYVTGDTHIPHDIAKLHPELFPQQEQMRKDDYVIICGDFGGVWNGGAEEKFWLKWLSERNFTTLFVDGNHENFALLGAYPTEEFCGGKVHQIADGVYHLMRGEIYVINDTKIFVMGGAASHDIRYRIEGRSWWREEMPSDAEYENAVINLTKHNRAVDYIITHCCPDSVQDGINPAYTHDKLTNFLERAVKADCQYKKWFFAHYHEDIVVDEKHICLYRRIIKIV
ncbi:MAG: metallophosphoesterase [Oscillospiraceae bacterium]|jgi:hypothetical protein|nr:metallophosphoesterase [Oscillospiraceae bacterium]